MCGQKRARKFTLNQTFSLFSLPEMFSLKNFITILLCYSLSIKMLINAHVHYLCVLVCVLVVNHARNSSANIMYLLSNRMLCVCFLSDLVCDVFYGGTIKNTLWTANLNFFNLSNQFLKQTKIVWIFSIIICSLRSKFIFVKAALLVATKWNCGLLTANVNQHCWFNRWQIS